MGAIRDNIMIIRAMVINDTKYVQYEKRLEYLFKVLAIKRNAVLVLGNKNYSLFKSH